MSTRLKDESKFAEDVFNEIKYQVLKLIPNNMKVVLGVSGGKDSTVTLKLLKEIIGVERIIPVLLPCGTQKDINDSKEICSILDVKPLELNIEQSATSVLNLIDNVVNPETWVNIQPRIRMTVLRAIASENNALLCGTGNASESCVGYFTKDGDGAYDINLIADLTTEELYALGKWLGEIPERLVIKTPTDGLGNKTDEEKLGITYQEIHDYLRGTAELSKDTLEKIRQKRVSSFHKKCDRYGCIDLTNIINKHYKDLRDELLLVIDLQNDFLSNGKLQAGDKNIDTKSNKAIEIIKKHYNRNALNTLFTFDDHRNLSLDYINVDGIKHTLPLHCDTDEGVSLPLELSDVILNGDNSVYKETYGTLDLLALINEIHKGKDIKVIGAVLDYCVLTNLILLRTEFPKINITLDMSACITSGKDEEVIIRILREHNINVILNSSIEYKDNLENISF